jgi:predicted Zn finger-like uncharacterized protein
MKFLCGNCKAKYQIADEKVSGRTLRMKCRRCGHDILIDGHAMTPSAAPPAPAAAPAQAPARKPGASSVIPAPPPRSDAARPPAGGQPIRGAGSTRSRPPSALSQDFRRHVAAPPEVPQRSAPYDLWHVAIQDVPVGPMTRDELGRKVESGAVTAESLCWREGMDDWRPMGELAELSQLLRRTRDGSRSGRPPPRTRRDASGPMRAPEPDLDDEGVEPTRAVAPPGPPPPVKPAAPPRSEPSLPLPAFAQKAPLAAPLPPVAKPPSASQQLPHPAPVPAPVPSPEPIAAVPTVVSPAQMVAPPQAKSNQGLYTGIAVGLLAGILLIGGPVLYRNTWGSPAPAAQGAVAPVVSPTPSPAVVAAPDLQLEVPQPDIAAPEPDKTTSKPGTAPVRTATKTEPRAGDTGPKLTDAERKLLERMGGGEGGGPSLSNAGRPNREDTPSGPALTASQLMSVVQNNKVQLQRCYETALRASGGKQDGAIKVTVNVTVGAAGSVKNVATEGNGLSTMNDCLRTSVRRWRFPQSGGDSEFAFPLVFQPGA